MTSEKSPPSCWGVNILFQCNVYSWTTTCNQTQGRASVCLGLGAEIIYASYSVIQMYQWTWILQVPHMQFISMKVNFVGYFLLRYMEDWLKW